MPKRQPLFPTRVRQCPVGGCKNICGKGALLCRDHWSQVPTDLQRLIWSELGESQKARSGLTPAYRVAARQAIQIAGGEVRSPVKEN